jgi:hypothetical protein
MKGEILIQNVFYLFIIAIVLEAAVMAIFSLTALKDTAENKPVKVARDMIVLGVSFFICYKVETLNVFRGTGIDLPRLLDVAISALVLTRMANFIRDFISRIKYMD